MNLSRPECASDKVSAHHKKCRKQSCLCTSHTAATTMHHFRCKSPVLQPLTVYCSQMRDVTSSSTSFGAPPGLNTDHAGDAGECTSLSGEAAPAKCKCRMLGGVPAIPTAALAMFSGCCCECVASCCKSQGCRVVLIGELAPE